jgi:ElaB/YqjD/DUF883 family membrane-anchored ribosome-binding protein
MSQSQSDNFEKAVSDVVEKGRQTLTKVVDNVGPAAKKGYQEVEKVVEDAVDTTTKQIKKYPFQSLLIGFGVGCLAGIAFKSFRDARA